MFRLKKENIIVDLIKSSNVSGHTIKIIMLKKKKVPNS